MSGDVRWVRASTVIARKVAGELVLVPVGERTGDPEFKSARLYVLNETGEVLWDLLASPHSSLDLARNLTREFDITQDRAHTDVEAFLAAMRDIGAVRPMRDEGGG